jgi:hypothetical protein
MMRLGRYAIRTDAKRNAKESNAKLLNMANHINK